LPAEPEPEDIPLNVVYEDGDIIVVNKPAGLVVHPAPGHPTGTLVNALLFHCADLGSIGGTSRPGIVHRLDKDTTGLLVVAKHEQALRNLAEQFQDGRTCKVYLALVHGCPQRESGTVRTTIGRHPTDRKRMAADPPRGKPAVTHYQIEERLGKVTLLRVRIETGRTHQIRVHMSHIGFPIVGDPVYGNRALDRAIPNCPSRQMLHAAEFSFDHPRDGRRMSFTAPPPADMEALLRSFREVL
jgi:23S rRNA pseudouridine1911/1915/1917 synthase